jgi:hypothetical protein
MRRSVPPCAITPPSLVVLQLMNVVVFTMRVFPLLARYIAPPTELDEQLWKKL